MAESTPSTSRGEASIASARDASSSACGRIRSTNSRAAVVTANSKHTERSFHPSTLATPGIATVEGSSSGRDLFSPLQSVNLDHKRLSGNIGSGGIFASIKFTRSRSRAATNANAAKVGGLWGRRRAIRYAIFAASVIAGIAWFRLIPLPGIYGSQDMSESTTSTSAASPNTNMATTMTDTADNSDDSGGFQYEVFGKVQGVFFRKHGQREAARLGLVGWVRNTDRTRSSVEGEVAGTADQSEELAQMRHWLGKVGSPKSRIERADFVPLSKDRVQELLELKEFVVRKTKTGASHELKKK